MIEQIKQNIDRLETEIKNKRRLYQKSVLLKRKKRFGLFQDLRVLTKELSTFKETVLMMADEEIKFIGGIIICGFTTDSIMFKELEEHNNLIKKKIEELQQIKQLCSNSLHSEEK
jgi:hypothetical protein